MNKVYWYLSFLLSFNIVACNTPNKEVYTKLYGNIFGTTYVIAYKGDNNYQNEIRAIFDNFNNSLSTYTSNSIISKVNNNDRSVIVDAYFREAFEKAKRIYKETEGFFDPTIGKLINAYGFGSGKAQRDLTMQEIDSLKNLMGFDKVVLVNNRVVKPKEIEFNVNAFAKGLGVDVVGRFLEDKNIKDYLVEIGGEIRARGNSPRNTPWKVAIDDPNTDGTRSQSRTIELRDQSMATSGNYRKFKLNASGQKVVHTVNPKTGLAQQNKLLSASVLIQGDCADVDAYATAFMAMGLDKTKEFLAEHTELKVVLLYANHQGAILEYSN